MMACVDELFERTGRKISIVAWSLGGVFARELAKQAPDKVRLAISLGSPITDNRNYTNARPLFEAINSAQPQPMRTGKFRRLREAPPVPTTSILTKTDGIVHWRGSVQHGDGRGREHRGPRQPLRPGCQPGRDLRHRGPPGPARGRVAAVRAEGAGSAGVSAVKIALTV